MNPTMFRLLATMAVALPVAGGLSDFFFPSLISPGLSQAMEAEPFPESLTSLAALVFVGLCALVWLAGVAGMLFFRSWARTLTLWTTAVGFAFYPLLGSSVYSWPSQALTEAGATAWGAMLAFAYTEPINSYFRPRAHDA